MKNETRNALDLYILRAEELEAGGFFSYLKEKRPIALNMSARGDSATIIEPVGPEDEATKAMITIFRPFIQQKPISFRYIASLCDDPDLSDEWKTQVVSIRSAVNAYLDTSPVTNESPGEPYPTRREILDTFIYGKILHVDDDIKRTLYEKWKSEEFHFLLLLTEFNAILANLSIAIVRIKNLSVVELKR